MMVSVCVRQFVVRLLPGVVGSLLAAPLLLASVQPDTEVFPHGVASGDPLPWAVVIWTRVTPVPAATPGSGVGAPSPLRWEVATDAQFSHIVRSGTVTAIATYDHTAAVDVWGLTPGTEYYYRYWYGSSCSRVGRTRTAPSWFARVRSVRFALVSCAHYERGFFAGYRHLAERDDLDFILHVGDYIYEYAAGGFGVGSGSGRVHDPLHEAVRLTDYRRRYAQYRSDPDLQALHARHPFIPVWDDHEVANDSWGGGAQNHTPGVEGTYADRQAQAYQAYFEWLPIRRPNPRVDPTRIYRRFIFGDLVDLSVLDLRQYRHEPVTSFDAAALVDPGRSMVGFSQLGWLGNTLMRSRQQWRLLANSVMFTPWQIPLDLPPATRRALTTMKSTTPGAIPVDPDMWGGYAGERQRIIRFLELARIPNVVFLTGDIHSTFANEVPANPYTYLADRRTVAVEFVTPSITSDNINEILGRPPRNPLSIVAEVGSRLLNPWIQENEVDSHGFTIIDVSPHRVRSETWHLSDRADPEATAHFYRGFLSFSGTSRLLPVAGPLGPR